jgi:hypothetical protein
MDRIHAEEFPKLQAAEIWTEGDYVIYVILGNDAKLLRTTLFAACFRKAENDKRDRSGGPFYHFKNL